MRNPLETANGLVTLIEETLREKPVVGSVREQLEGALAMVTEVAAVLADLQANVVDLSLADANEDLWRALEAWRGLEAGQYGPGDKALEVLAESSPALSGLQRAGIRMKGFRRFSAAEERIAAAMGDLYRDAPEVVHAFKNAATHGQQLTRFVRRDLEATQTFFRAMEATGAIAAPVYEVFAYGKKRWIPSKPDKLRYQRNDGQPIRARHGAVNGYLRSFVTGDWLTAFAAHVASDHLTVNGVPHEALTMVAYEAPRDLLDDRSDLDVLVRAGDRVVLVECKAGRVDTNGGGAGLSALIERAAGLERVLRDAGGYTGAVDALLVFNPHLTPRDEVEARLAGTGVRAVAPDELRSTVLELFRAEVHG